MIPRESAKTQDRANELFLAYQEEGLKKGQGKLFTDVKKVLQGLKEQNIRLFVASNGLDRYVKSVIHQRDWMNCLKGYTALANITRSPRCNLLRCFSRSIKLILHGWSGIVLPMLKQASKITLQLLVAITLHLVNLLSLIKPI